MSIKKEISTTIEYARKYGQVLTERQIEERLIGKEVYSSKEIRRAIKHMGELINGKENDYYAQKMTKASKLADKLSRMFKDLLFIGVTGSVAAENPGKNDDIDLMMITRRNKLWVVRLLLRFYIFVSAIPHRKYGEKQKKDEFCFNLWLDETALELPENKRNLKNAVDMILMKPLFNKLSTYEQFIIVNQWVNKYLATPYERKYRRLFRSMPFEKDDLKMRGFDILVNKLMYWPQKLWMRKKITNELVDEHRAFFHKSR